MRSLTWSEAKPLGAPGATRTRAHGSGGSLNFSKFFLVSGRFR